MVIDKETYTARMNKIRAIRNTSALQREEKKRRRYERESYFRALKNEGRRMLREKGYTEKAIQFILKR